MLRFDQNVHDFVDADNVSVVLLRSRDKEIDDVGILYLYVPNAVRNIRRNGDKVGGIRSHDPADSSRSAIRSHFRNNIEPIGFRTALPDKVEFFVQIICNLLCVDHVLSSL